MDESKPSQPSSSPGGEITLNSQAKELSRKLTADYGTSLVNLAKILAAQQRVDQVQRVYIEQASDVLKKTYQKDRARDLLLTVGGALLGAFLQGFIDALAENKKLLIVVYVIAGFLGMGLVFWALRQR
jgi:F0F1-type ATP synthase assembly protein I